SAWAALWANHQNRLMLEFQKSQTTSTEVALMPGTVWLSLLSSLSPIITVGLVVFAVWIVFGKRSERKVKGAVKITTVDVAIKYDEGATYRSKVWPVMRNDSTDCADIRVS